MSWWNYNRYTPTQTRQAKGGIKSQSKRGAFGKNWWAKQWIAILEGFNMGARLTRGRSYARRGQVISIDIDKGMVIAKVQGSRKRPYKVGIKVKTISASDWKKLAKSLSQQVLIAAKLLAGEMPDNIESAFEQAGFSLFPKRRVDLETDCSCPDWSNPCKHIAAVYYLLGEEFDRNPFLIMKLRGMNREDLIKLLGGAKKSQTGLEPVEQELPPEPLPVDLTAFWGEEDSSFDITGEVQVPKVAASLPKRLGNFPFWRGKDNFLESLERIYDAASLKGMDVFIGEE
jgi:uncharacterized Zn finger protein